MNITDNVEAIPMPILVCCKCRKRWLPRFTHPPKVCPRCKTKKWNRQQDETTKETHA